jgi:hypothetical protein
MKIARSIPFFFLAFVFIGCTSVGTLGIMTKNMGDTAQILKSGREFRELGSVEGRACRFFLIALIPWGDSTVTAAMNDALTESGGDGMINVTVSSSLYGFVPIYNVFAFTCTSVQGIAIKFEPLSSSSSTVPSSSTAPSSSPQSSGP